MTSPKILRVTLATGEPAAARADMIAYLRPANNDDAMGCIVGFNSTGWMRLADSYDAMERKWREAIGAAE